MSTTIKVPLLLQPDKLDELNRKLIAQTGCFAFIRTEQVLLAAKPKSNRDAFANYIIGLYVVFHDYSCRIITGFMCNNDYTPNGMSIRHEEIKEIINRIERLRHGIAHGSVYPDDHNELQRILFHHYIANANPNIDYSCVEQWPNLVNILTEKDWRYAIENLIIEADKVYQYIEEWGCKHAESSHGDRIKNDFGKNPNFYESYDQRVCDRILIENNVIEEKKRKDYLNKDNGYLCRWQQEIKRCFEEENISDPDRLLSILKREIQRTVNPPVPSSVVTGKKYDFGF